MREDEEEVKIEMIPRKNNIITTGKFGRCRGHHHVCESTSQCCEPMICYSGQCLYDYDLVMNK